MSWLANIYPTDCMPPCRFEGEASKVLGFIEMMATTEPIETDGNWWRVRVIALSWKN